MNKLIIILITFLMFGCSNSQKFADLRADIVYLEKSTEKNKRRIVWLQYQKRIDKIKPKYPEDIALIKAQGAKWKSTLDEYNSYECELICFVMKFYPVPLSENKKHGRLYLIFDQDRGVNKFLQVYNKQLIIVKMPELEQKWDEKSMYKSNLNIDLLYLLQ